MDAQGRIKDMMVERGWTEYRLAKESGLSHSTVTNKYVQEKQRSHAADLGSGVYGVRYYSGTILRRREPSGADR